MKKLFTHITRVSQLFLLIVVMVANSLGNQAAYAVATSSSTSYEQKKDNQTTDSSDDETTVRELSIQSLLPSHAFSFNNQVFLCPAQPIATWFFTVQNYAPSFSNGYIASYFSNIFERLIAINAP